jgi:hypothetical protein
MYVIISDTINFIKERNIFSFITCVNKLKGDKVTYDLLTYCMFIVDGEGYPSAIAYGLAKQSQSISNAFQVSNQNRFGESIQNKKPLENKPPPGAYTNVIPSNRMKSAIMGKLARATGHNQKYRGPGPAYYKPTVEPKATSYHLNVQNMWLR